MPFTINEFKARVRDLHRAYQFQINMLWPTVIGAPDDNMNILAQGHNLPGRSFEEIDCGFMGAPYKLAGAVSYADWGITFRVDDNLDIYKKLRAWSELIHGTATNIASFPAQYKSAPIIYQLDNSGNKLTEIKLTGAWPLTVGDLAYDTTSKAILTCAATFKYDFSEFKVL